MAQRSPNNTHCIEVAVGTQRPIEIIRQIFAGKVSDDAYAGKCGAERARAFGHAGGFHFDGNPAFRAQFGLFRRPANDAIDRTDGARPGSPPGERKHGVTPELIGNARTDYDVGDAERRVERAAEPDADDAVGRQNSPGGIDGSRGAMAPDSVGDQQSLSAGQGSGARPIGSQRDRSGRVQAPENAAKFRRRRGYQQKPH